VPVNRRCELFVCPAEVVLAPCYMPLAAGMLVCGGIVLHCRTVVESWWGGGGGSIYSFTLKTFKLRVRWGMR
jgi:hypothetical protein